MYGLKLSLILWSEYLNFAARCLDASAGQRKPATETCSPNSPTEMTAAQIRDRIEGFELNVDHAKPGADKGVVTILDLFGECGRAVDEVFNESGRKIGQALADMSSPGRR